MLGEVPYRVETLLKRQQTLVKNSIEYFKKLGVKENKRNQMGSEKDKLNQNINAYDPINMLNAYSEHIQNI